MRALLRAGLRRDLHSIYTYLALAVSLICGVFMMLIMSAARTEMMRSELLGFALILLVTGEAVSAAVLLLRGALEHDSGMIRNRLIGGASKGEIILTELILAAGLSLLQCLLTAGLFLYGVLLGSMHITLSQTAKLLLVCITGYLFFAVIMTVAWYYAPRASAAVIAGCVIFTFIGMSASILNGRLSEPEYYTVTVDAKYDENGKLISHRQLINENPEAIHGTLRKVCEAAQVINPLQTPSDLCEYLDTYLAPDYYGVMQNAEQRHKTRSLLIYRPTALFGMTLLLFAGGILFAPKKNFN